MMNTAFEPGSPVRVRDREWVVLPGSSTDLLMVRPMGGNTDEITGIYLPLETVQPSCFDLPNPNDPGDYRSCRLLRDAIRLGFRSTAGPFRSFGRLGVEPRPYQLVPLLMALKMDTAAVRLLIADDVGVGKTIEAGVIARELLDRGLARRLAVICPPHLVDQWREELAEKFNIDAQTVTSGSAARLERNRGMGQTLFDIYPYVIVSLDFIKSDKRRDDFNRTCPDLVIIDEAHTCAFGAAGRGRQQRHQLVKGLAQDPERHMIFLTATPHSGNENAFRSLVGLLHADFEKPLPDEAPDKEHEKRFQRLSKFMVQRRREDIASYLDTETRFPVRESVEETYNLSPGYKKLFNRVLEYARESVADKSGGRLHERVRWWSALALLRALASSPAAAAASLKTRANVDNLSPDEVDDMGKQAVLDLVPDEAADHSDITPGGQADDDPASSLSKRLLAMARDAEALQGHDDVKLHKGIEIVRDLLDRGYRPVIFCRFIHTADYLAGELSKSLGPGVMVNAVTGLLPSEERESRVHDFAQAGKGVLVATDCLSEGINLQEYFDAVFHYDLSWNPTRHEQREGRVDRFGQSKPTVRMVTLYGADNQIDGIVLDVLIRKHRIIRESLKISIPVPTDTDKVIEALFEGLLLREHTGSVDSYLPGFEEFLKPQKEQLHMEWDTLSKKEVKSRRLFTHSSIKVDEVAGHLAAVRNAMGSGKEVESFFIDAWRAYGAQVTDGHNGGFREFSGAPADLKAALDLTQKSSFRAWFHQPACKDILYLHRTHPLVEGLARRVSDSALDPLMGPESAAKRCGVIRTEAVTTRTTLILVRFRFHISSGKDALAAPTLAEECIPMAFEGSPQAPAWLSAERAEWLMEAKPNQNINKEEARYFLEKVIHDFDLLIPYIEERARVRAGVLIGDHAGVSASMGVRAGAVRVEPVLPPDAPGIYIYLPALSASEGV